MKFKGGAMIVEGRGYENQGGGAMKVSEERSYDQNDPHTSPSQSR